MKMKSGCLFVSLGRFLSFAAILLASSANLSVASSTLTWQGSGTPEAPGSGNWNVA
jgi:hypothetical protein